MSSFVGFSFPQSTLKEARFVDPPAGAPDESVFFKFDSIYMNEIIIYFLIAAMTVAFLCSVLWSISDEWSFRKSKAKNEKTQAKMQLIIDDIEQCLKPKPDLSDSDAFMKAFEKDEDFSLEQANLESALDLSSESRWPLKEETESEQDEVLTPKSSKARLNIDKKSSKVLRKSLYRTSSELTIAASKESLLSTSTYFGEAEESDGVSSPKKFCGSISFSDSGQNSSSNDKKENDTMTTLLTPKREKIYRRSSRYGSSLPSVTSWRAKSPTREKKIQGRPLHRCVMN